MQMKDRNGIELQDNDKVKIYDSRGDFLIYIYKNGYLFSESETDLSMKNVWAASSFQIEKI